MKAITCPVILTGASTRVDGSIGLKFATPELSASDKAAFFELLNLNMTMLLQPSGEEPKELKEVKGEFDTKTPGQRLRAVLYVLWKETDGTGEFEEFYRRRMNSIIDKIKEKFPDKV
jgi:hypothetical protein